MIELRDSLRYRGLSPYGLAAWAGTDRLSALHALVPRLAAREHAAGGALLALFVAGAELPAALVPSELLDRLLAAGLAERAGNAVRAPISLLPIGEAFVACDRLDTLPVPELVRWPDDSSYHLALSIPPRDHARWLDLGCGSGFAQLWRGALATELGSADVNARALELARRGAELSGIALHTFEADLGDGVPRDWLGTCALVTCNAPIPGGDDPYRTLWTTTDETFVPRAFEHARALLAPGGTLVVHAALDALVPVIDSIPGERVVVAYTPAGTRGFAVAWWRPDGDPLAIGARRELTAERPHVAYRDRVAAIAGELSPL